MCHCRIILFCVLWCVTVVVLVLSKFVSYIDGLVRERRNSIALAMQLRLSCTNPSILVQTRRNSSTLAMELHLSCNYTSILTYTPFILSTHIVFFDITVAEQALSITATGISGTSQPHNAVISNVLPLMISWCAYMLKCTHATAI